MNILNNIIFVSFSGFALFFMLLVDIFWDEKKKFDKTNENPKVRTIWTLSIIDGFFFLIFILSLFIKLINILFN